MSSPNPPRQPAFLKPAKKPSALDFERALRPLAVVILVSLVIYLPASIYTATQEDEALTPQLTSASELTARCLKLQQAFDFEAEQVGPVLYRLQTADAIARRRAHWVRALNQCLLTLPSTSRVAALTITQEPSQAAGDELTFGEDFDSYRPPPSVPALKMILSCEIGPKDDAIQSRKQIQGMLESIPGVQGFKLVDAHMTSEGGVSRSSLVIQFLLSPAGG
ncbi:MAG: hypothetical protein QF437_17020 [Planctomycetota bacterium]|jgi:hypothetical protein|nr:hypothetical protein [Planctomycetota bacterium]MDP7132202.1 hypothetical protein [Planctomycetota bacterium]